MDRTQQYYEERTIKDINHNVFPIWVVYRIDEWGRPRQICVFDVEEHFKSYAQREKPIFRPTR